MGNRQMKIQFYFVETGEVIDGRDCSLFVYLDSVWQDNFDTCESQEARVGFDDFIRERQDIGWRAIE